MTTQLLWLLPFALTVMVHLSHNPALGTIPYITYPPSPPAGEGGRVSHPAPAPGAGNT